jgi:putative membrane protein
MVLRGPRDRLAGETGSARRVRLLRFLVFLVIFVIAGIFAVVNPDEVVLDHYFGVYKAPLAAWLAAALGLAAVGALLGALACLGTLLRLRRENAALKRDVRLAFEEVRNLCALPLKDP